MIRAENISKSFKNHTIFKNLNLTINDGDIVGVIAPSGSGKSLLLRTLLMIDPPDSGKIFLDDVELTAPYADLIEARKNIGLVFQDFNLFSHLTALENVLSGPLHLRGENPDIALENALNLLDGVGLKERAYFYPNQLSGGQKQRVAIARTLAMNPSTILFDEPTSALDPSMKGEVETVIQHLASKGHTMVISSHEIEFLKSICNRIIFLYEGSVYEEGNPQEIFENPKRDATRRFVHALKVLEFEVESKSYDFIGIQTQIYKFAYRNNVPMDLCYKLRSIMEELCQMVIKEPKAENKLKASFEYNANTKSLKGMVYFSGEEFDPDNPLYIFSWPIIKLRCSNISYEKINEDGYSTKMDMEVN